MNREADLVEVIDGLVRSRGALESAANVLESMSDDGEREQAAKACEIPLLVPLTSPGPILLSTE